MNKQIALLLLAKLADASYLDRTSGIVQVIRRLMPSADPDDNAPPVTRFLPYTSFATYEQCGKLENAMVPNSKFKSCLYFEDNGITSLGNTRRGFDFRSRLRLVCWLNTFIIAGHADPLLSGVIMADIIKRLVTLPFNSSPFLHCSVSIEGIPVQDALVFAKYDYKESDRQFLMQPYDFFALDLSCTYTVAPDCVDEIISVNAQKCTPNI